MCEQTEINYLDGDIVWVKLGACWWPGEVTSVQNLPEDIQVEFRKKPLIAAVKFFQEDTYEFVKNLHQIYKYNCTQKDEFIKKGLDKYRTKSKDGSSYMDKFPGDVEMAEKLTGGNPDILTSQKFSREEKPDISALFGEKKIPKRKRDSTDMHRRSDGGVVVRKITHPRFLRESDHEIRIRQQPSSLPSTPKTPSSDSPQFSCHLCNFTSSRVNVIICHTKSHRSGSFESPVARPRISTHTQPKTVSRPSTGDTQKRKYVKKAKSPTSKNKTDKKSEPVKRKYTKQIEKTTPTTKKKKTDPELREKLLADWDDGSDEDMDIDLNKSIDSSIGSPSTKIFESSINITSNSDEKMDEDADDGAEIIKASEKLLRDTDKLTTLLTDDSTSRAASNSNNKHSEDIDVEDKSTSLVKDEKSLTPKKFKKSFVTPDDGKKTVTAEKDDKQSRFSCFDFDEEDLPEPTITPVRKIPRIFGEKNTSVKKEILKKFTLSQAMKHEKDEKTDKIQQNFSRKKEEESIKEKKLEKDTKEMKVEEDTKEKKVEDEKKKKVDDKKDKKIEDKKEKKLDDKKEKKLEDKKDKKLDDKKDKKLEDKKELKFEENKEKKLEDKNEKKLDDKKEKKLEDKIENKQENKTEKFEKATSPEPRSFDNELKSSAKEDQEDDEITKAEAQTINENPDDNLKNNATETVEIVEILEVEAEKDETDETIIIPEKVELQPEIILPLDKINEIIDQPMETEVPVPKDDIVEKIDEITPEKSSLIQPEKEQIPIVKRTENLSEKDEIMSEIATTETEDETVSEIAESLQGHSENSDTDLTQGSWESAAKTKVIIPKETKEIVEKVAPRRRGRPRKSINVSEVSGNGDDSLKIEAVNKLKDSLASRHSERKTSESDSDRSYTGRRRKPNKRYLHSEIYARSPDNRTSKTDESQSETEEKSQKEPKGRSKRGRKPAAIVESRIETLEKSKDQEFEFSSPSVELPEVQDEASASKISDNEQKDVQDKKFDVTETENESNTSSLLDSGKKLDAIGSPVNITKFLSGDAEISTKQDEETKEKSIQSIEEKIIKAPTVIEQMDVPEEPKNVTKFDKLPPKKSQIKKFELSQIDLLEACSVQVAAESAAERSMEFSGDTDMDIYTVQSNAEAVIETLPKKEVKIDIPETIQSIALENNEATSEIKPVDNAAEELVKNSTIETVEAELARITSEEVDQREKIEDIPMPEEKEPEKTEIELKIESIPKPEVQPVAPIVLPKQSEPTIQKHIFPAEKFIKDVKQIHDEDLPPNSYQEAFLKTLLIDKDEDKNKFSNVLAEKLKEPEIPPESVSIEVKTVAAVVINKDPVAEQAPIVPTLNAMTEFEGVEILVQENIEVPTKFDAANASQIDLASSLSEADVKLDEANTLSSDLQKIEDTLTDAVSTPSPTPDICVPVKKREKPRIIENVTLKEPMQILKSKLLEKLPSKTTKHKLDSDTPKKSEKGAPRAKMMKIDSPSPKKSPTKSHFTVSRKLQALKAEESANLAAEKEQEKGQIQVSQTITHPADGEKFIQQSSQSLADMELDINSMPFVLSEDVLTPESIEQMPVVISSLIPSSSSAQTIVTPSPSSSSSSSVPTSLTHTPTTQLVAPNQVQSVTTETPTTGKKKSGTPAILKNKGKAKPTITSIKTLVPPLTGGVKGIKFQSPQPGKAMPLISQKSTPGKYVIVQTGGQQMRYSVQGKPGMSQKVAIPTGKTAGNAQIVQQGGKVVILTSAQSGQTKMLPLNISKTLSSKVQKIVNNKGQIYTPINPQGIMSTKTMIAPKSDAGSPTTSKLAPGTKIISAQGMISKGGLLTPISSSQSGLISTLSQGIITKGGLYTPISSAQLAGKTIISGKTIVNKAGRIFSTISSQASGTSKPVLAPISHTITGKTIMNAQGIVTPKGTILTPITGQQVKALAAKSPAKTGKVQYQAVQQKLQLPMLQKCQKIPISSGSQTKVSSGVKSPSASGTIVFQNAIVPGQKVTTPTGKKIVRQVVGVRSPQTAVTQTATASPQQILQQKIGKTTGTTPTMQRVVVPRGRQTKSQQKIVVQKLQETTATGSSPLMNIQGKSSSNIVGNVVKTQKSPVAHRGVAKANKNAQQQQKHLLNVALSSISGSNETSTPALRQSQVQPPPLAPLVSTELATTEHEGTTKIDKNIDNIAKDNIKMETPRDLTGEGQKIEEKVPTQPQIMALPTETSDGTQTYVLVTIDEQGQIQPLDNNTLMSLEGTTQNSDGTRTLYIDPSSLGEAGALDNIVLQFDNGALPNIQSTSNVGESSQTTVSNESFSSSEIIQTSNQDILAAALANTDFQQEIGLPENTVSSVMPSLTQTSLINQTILQSTIIPPTEPISSPSVLETSLTLNQPIMTPLEVPSSLPIQVEPTPQSVVSTIPTSLELPITITNPNISYIASSPANETHIQIPGNSMPDIGEIMESPANAEIAQEIPASTQYLVIPTLDENMTIQAQAIETGTDSASGSVSYSVSIPETAVIETSQAQTTPSMPIIDDSFAESAEQNFETPVTDISAAKPTDESKVAETPTETSNMIIETETTKEVQKIDEETTETQESLSAQETPEKIVVPVEESPIVENLTITEEIPAECSVEKDSTEKMEVDDEPIAEEIAISVSTIEDTVSTEMQVEVQSSESLQIETTHSEQVPATSQVAEVEAKPLESSISEEVKNEVPTQENSNNEVPTANSNNEVPTANSAVEESALQPEMVIEQPAEMEINPVDDSATPEVAQSVETSSQAEAAEPEASETVERMEQSIAETSQEEAPSQSYEQFNSSSVASESIDSPTQSAGKSENSREPSQSIVYDPMEIDENIVTGEPPTQSFDDSKQNEASQSYETSVEVNTNAPTQSFNEIMQCQEEGTSAGNAIDDQSFPTQSYEVGKMENLLENLENDGAVSQEGNIPSQSNDIGIDGIGTSSVSTNNLGLNEDETASSSYMPETPENQERDQDQESAISTSSYEIPPCEELNIASSSVIPDTSASAEHTSIHNNGVPEIPTSSYSLNPDSSSTSHVDTLPTSSYEDQVIVEQNVSTSYEVPISMPGLEENSAQNFVTESTDHRDEPSSYYARHPEVSASYYETVNQDSNSRLEADHPQEEVTPSYYETPQDITSEASQSYFRPTPRYSSQSVSPSYYEAAPESEASQSYYSHEIEATEQSSRNVEASQSFYQETNDEIRLRQQGEATPTYTERYPVDYALANSPIERHDLVESSVPATRPTER